MFTVVSPDFTLLFKEHPHEVDLKQVLLLKANFLSDERKSQGMCVHSDYFHNCFKTVLSVVHLGVPVQIPEQASGKSTVPFRNPHTCSMKQG